jgi:hypothetical protein
VVFIAVRVERERNVSPYSEVIVGNNLSPITQSLGGDQFTLKIQIERGLIGRQADGHTEQAIQTKRTILGLRKNKRCSSSMVADVHLLNSRNASLSKYPRTRTNMPISKYAVIISPCLPQ